MTIPPVIYTVYSMCKYNRPKREHFGYIPMPGLENGLRVILSKLQTCRADRESLQIPQSLDRCQWQQESGLQ